MNTVPGEKHSPVFAKPVKVRFDLKSTLQELGPIDALPSLDRRGTVDRVPGT